MARRLTRSISTKLVMLVLGSVCLAVGIATTVSLWQEANRYVGEKQQALLAVAHVFASAAAPAVAEGDERGVFASLRGLAEVPGVVYAVVTTADGRLLSQSGVVTRLRSDMEMREPTMWSVLASRNVEVAAPVVRAGERVGELRLVGDTSDLLYNLLSTLKFTVLAGLAALAAALLVAARLQRGITSPLRQLTRTMRGIRESHDYTTRVEVESDDEVGVLVDGFNTMLSEISERDARLENHRRNLERDIAERTADLALARDAAEQASAAKSAFLATMSHEIRTPMNGILVMAELLASGELPPKERRYAEVVAKSGHGLLAIINDILDFSKIESGKLDLEELPIDPATLADEVVTLFAERARSKGLDLAAHVDPATPLHIVGDPVRLNQVIGNLVNNALKFTEKGHVLLTVEPDPDGPGDVRFAVHDTGIGIPESKIGQLFQTFSQADQSTTRRFGGTGLGLAISKRLVDAMGGEFRVTSREGHGSTFAFSVGRAKEGEKRDYATAGNGDMERLAVRVIVGGDATRLALSRYLEAAGHRLMEAEGDAAADLVVHDGDMPTGVPMADGARRVRLQPMGAEAATDCDAVLTNPVLYSEVSMLLQRIAAGEELQSLSATVVRRDTLPRYEGLRVLVADDSPVNREVMIETLSRFGIVPDLVENGLEALNAATETQYHLVFMDGSMPEMDGFEATRRIRAAEVEAGKSAASIVALTAHVVGSASEAWRDAGMDGVVHKPFTIADIAACLATHAGQFETAPSGSEIVETSPVAPAKAAPSAAKGKPDDSDELPILSPEMQEELAQMAAAGRSDFVSRVLGLYLDHMPGSIEKLHEGLAAGDLEQAGAAAHAVKSMSFNIGASRVAAAAAKIEHAARLEEVRPTEEQLSMLSAALDETLAAVRTRLAELTGAPVEKPAVSNEPAAVREPEAGESMEAALARAAERDELTVVYQPLVERSSHRTTSAEALLRWSWKGENVSPAAFIPAAERSGAILKIGEHVLRRVCREAQDWRIDVAVNVSPVQLQDPGFADLVRGILEETGFNPRRLELEITEMALIEDEARALGVIEELKAIGIRFALDDFGTGYSSLTYLRRLPVDKIKVDKSFVQSVENSIDGATIIHAIVGIGRALGKKVVAEGVETEGELRFLTAAGVHFLQGYYFAKPLPPEVLAQRLHDEFEALRQSV